MHRLSVAAAFCAALVIAFLSGCSGSNEQIGGVLGTITGGVAGSRISTGSTRVLTTIAGAGLGAWIGSRIGAALDERDRREAERAALAALEQPEPRPVAWRNTKSGNGGEYVATRVAAAPRGKTCKRLTHRATVKGAKMEETDNYCVEDGKWRKQVA